MSATPQANIRLSEADIDAVIAHLRRVGQPLTLDQMAEVLLEIWRRRREGR